MTSLRSTPEEHEMVDKCLYNFSNSLRHLGLQDQFVSIFAEVIGIPRSLVSVVSALALLKVGSHQYHLSQSYPCIVLSCNYG